MYMLYMFIRSTWLIS